MRTAFWVLVAGAVACASGSHPQQGTAPPAPAPPAAINEAHPIAFSVPALFGDHMVLQRDRPNPIWGSDRPTQAVTVSIDGKAQSLVADENGRWRAMLPAFPAGGPHVIEVRGSEARRIEDVVFGEVWLASGQSNIEFELGRARDAATVIPAAKRPELRMFTVKKNVAGAPALDVVGSWQVSSPETAPRFSAVAYFFAEMVRAALDVPVGIIHSSWGGTPAEAWTSRTALAARAETKPLADRYAATVTPESDAAYQRAKTEWHDKVYCKDPGNAGLALHYADTEFDDSKWKEIDVPGLWQERGLAINGAVWFRRAFELTPAETKLDFELELGPIDDFDETYVNGKKVGGLGFENPDAWQTRRRYRVPAAVLKPGRNVVAVRVFDHFGGGGFHGAPSELRVFPTGRVAAARPLAGRWRYLVEWSVPYPKELLGKEPQPPAGPSNQNSPGVLFDGMIAPLVPYGLRGAIWYQGEANVGRAAEYQVLLPTLIADWRARFHDDFPFYVVQLANFLARTSTPQESAWAELRDAQAKVAASVPSSGLAVTIDIGDGGDIHPTNKRDVGERLARVALAKTYQKPVEFSGPVLESVKAEGAKLRLAFSHADGGLKLVGDGKKPLGFAIAGADKRFAWADAKLDGKSVVLSSPNVREPRHVRYAWGDNPEVNLVNGEKLPAVPFEAEVSAPASARN
ncbi:MAG TPA: sialate O-acetylesterase [Polyangiaceae bacterium]|nr:sialate O-acetylesterase [Polyangiaceae bacterium]